MLLVPQYQAFCCPYCAEKFGLEYNRRHRSRHILDDSLAWHRHVLSDIRPYACIFQPCVQPDFCNKRSWMNHILYDHGIKGSSWSVITEQESKTPLPPPEDPVYRCPFCKDFKDVGCRGTDPVQRPTIEGLMPLLEHIAKHMEQLALMTLPYYVQETALPVTPDAVAGVSRLEGSPGHDVSPESPSLGRPTPSLSSSTACPSSSPDRSRSQSPSPLEDRFPWAPPTAAAQENLGKVRCRGWIVKSSSESSSRRKQHWWTTVFSCAAKEE